MSLLLLLKSAAASAAALESNVSVSVSATAALSTQIPLSAANVYFSDNFNRADQALDASANWERADTDVGSLSIVGNAVVAASGVNIGNVYAGALPNDQWAEFTFRGVSPSGTAKGAAVLLRATGGAASFTGYTISLSRNNTEAGTDLLQIRYCSNVATFTAVFTAGTLLASRRVPDFAGNTSGNVVLRAEIVGSRITAYVDGSAWLSVTDVQLASGKVGIFSDSATIEDFSCGSFENRAHTFAEGSLSSAIRLAGAVAVSVSQTADLTTQAGGAVLESAASAAATATAALTTQIPLSSSAATSVTAAAAITTAIPLAASVNVSVAYDASLTAGGGGLAASASATVTSAAALTTEIRLAGSASAPVTAAAGLTTAIPLTASAAAAVTAAAAVSTGIALASSAAATVTQSAALTAPAAGLEASGAVSVTSSAALTSAIRLASSVTALVVASAELTAGATDAVQQPAGRSKQRRKEALQRALDDAVRRARQVQPKARTAPQIAPAGDPEPVYARAADAPPADDARMALLIAQIERLEMRLVTSAAPAADVVAAIGALEAQALGAEAAMQAEQAEMEEVALIAAILEAA